MADREPRVAMADREPRVAMADREPRVAMADREPRVAMADREPQADAVTLVFKKHNGPTPADDIAPQIIRLWKLNTGLQATWAMSFSTLPPDSRTLVSKVNTKIALI